MFKRIKYVIDGERDPDHFDYHCARMHKMEVKQMTKDEFKEILKADIDKIDIHFDFNDSAVAKVNIQLKGIPEQFEYEYENTNVNSMKVNKIDTQLQELGSAIMNKLNYLAYYYYGLITESYKNWFKDDIEKFNTCIIEDAYVAFNGKTVGKYIIGHTSIDGNKILNYIKIESEYNWELLDKPVIVFITHKYGRVLKEITGYLTAIEKQDNEVSITIEQEFVEV